MKKLLITTLVPVVAFFAACASSSEPSTFADVCQKENESLVSIEGYLMLPNFMNPATNHKDGVTSYQLFLALQPDGKGQSVLTSVAGTRSNEPNTIADLSPMGYTYRDFRIFTDRGSTVGATDRVKVTGKLVRGTNNCQIVISKIEVP